MWYSRSTVLTNVRDDLLCSAINVLDMAGAGFLLIAAASVMLSVDTGHHLVRTVRIRVSRAVDLLVLCGTAFVLLQTVVAFPISVAVVFLNDTAHVFFNALQGRCLFDTAI